MLNWIEWIYFSNTLQNTFDPAEARNGLYARHKKNIHRTFGVTLKIPKPNKESFKKSVIFRGGTLWNLLPGEVRNLPTLSDFKKVYENNYKINRLR